MKTKRKCLNCSTSTMKKISEGLSGRTWYVDYECTECKKVQVVPRNKPAPIWKTEYSIMNTISTPIGINEKDWPDND